MQTPPLHQTLQIDVRNFESSLGASPQLTIAVGYFERVPETDMPLCWWIGYRDSTMVTNVMLFRHEHRVYDAIGYYSTGLQFEKYPDWDDQNAKVIAYCLESGYRVNDLIHLPSMI